MGTVHPYRLLSDRHFWLRTVATDFDSDDLGTLSSPLIQSGQKVMSAGSCFAATLVPYIEKAGFDYVRTTQRHPAFGDLQDNFNYDVFSAAYGNIYTVRHLLQLIRRCRSTFRPREDRWHDKEAVIDAFRPGLRYFAKSDREFDILTAQHIELVAAAIRACDVFVFTLGLTEAWCSRLDGAVFPACPGTIAGTFDESRHAFINLTVADCTNDLNAFVREAREINPGLKVILTVSPVPMVATASDHHVLVANTYTKSVLRVAAEEVARHNRDVVYFPGYEIVIGPQAPKDVFADDRRTVSPDTIRLVMSSFLAKCDVPEPSPDLVGDDRTAMLTDRQAMLSELSARIIDRECEEMGQER